MNQKSWNNGKPNEYTAQEKAYDSKNKKWRHQRNNYQVKHHGAQGILVVEAAINWEGNKEYRKAYKYAALKLFYYFSPELFTIFWHKGHFLLIPYILLLEKSWVDKGNTYDGSK